MVGGEMHLPVAAVALSPVSPLSSVPHPPFFCKEQKQATGLLT